MLDLSLLSGYVLPEVGPTHVFNERSQAFTATNGPIAFRSPQLLVLELQYSNTV